MTKRATKDRPKIATMTATELSLKSSRVVRDAEYGRRTAITFHGEVVAAVVSADDLKVLEAER